MNISFRKMTIIGVGLIGGSLARVCKKHGLVKEIIGVGRTEANLKRAKELGIIDEYCFDVKEGCRDADLVILATPVSSFEKIAREIGSVLPEGAIVTDVGSVKIGFLSGVENALPDGVHFVGAHPIAGTEKSGAEASSLELFQGAKCIITPTENTDEKAMRMMEELWEIAGSKVIIMDPVKHDRILAAVSHLPHVVAYALVNTLVDIGDMEKDVLAFAAGGFKDFTRIASSSPEMWADICFLNKDCIIDSIHQFKSNLEMLESLIENNRDEDLKEMFQKAKNIRDNMIK